MCKFPGKIKHFNLAFIAELRLSCVSSIAIHSLGFSLSSFKANLYISADGLSFLTNLELPIKSKSFLFKLSLKQKKIEFILFLEVEETKASLISCCLQYFIISLTPVLNLSLFFF